MSSYIDTQDSRTGRAVEILAESSQWIKCWLKRPEDQARYHSEKAYGIASQTKPGMFHLTNTYWCSCEDQARHPSEVCKHREACRLLVAVTNHQRAAVAPTRHRKGLMEGTHPRRARAGAAS